MGADVTKVPLFQEGGGDTSPDGLAAQLADLRDAFAAHDHDGVNSRSFTSIIAQTISVANALIGGYRLFEAVVGPVGSGANYPTVAAALLAGKSRIFVRNGTYTSEPKWAITAANTVIQGESLGGVSITFAQDVSNARSIYVNAARATFENMKLTSYEAAQQDLFQFGSSGQFPTVRNCIVRNRQGKFFNSASLTLLYGTFENIYADCLGTSDATLMIVFASISNSMVTNCLIDMDFSNSGFLPVSGCGNTYFTNCSMKMAASRAVEYTISNSGTCFFSSCYFYAYQIKPDANFENCFFENNGNSPAGYFITIDSAVSRLNSSVIKIANDQNILTISSANVQVCGNYFDGGKSMVFEPSGSSILGIQFCNNQWVSSYTTAAIDLRLGSIGHVADYTMVTGNIIRNNSNSFTPTITNNSSNCTITPNHLIKG